MDREMNTYTSAQPFPCKYSRQKLREARPTKNALVGVLFSLPLNHGNPCVTKINAASAMEKIKRLVKQFVLMEDIYLDVANVARSNWWKCWHDISGAMIIPQSGIEELNAMRNAAPMHVAHKSCHSKCHCKWTVTLHWMDYGYSWLQKHPLTIRQCMETITVCWRTTSVLFVIDILLWLTEKWFTWESLQSYCQGEKHERWWSRNPCPQNECWIRRKGELWFASWPSSMVLVAVACIVGLEQKLVIYTISGGTFTLLFPPWSSWYEEDRGKQ